MNIVVLQGNLTNDIDYRVSNSGIKIAKGTLAVSRTFSKKKETDYIGFVVIGDSADYCSKYGRKGTKTLVKGQWQHSSYKDKEGNTHYSDNCMVEDIKFFNEKPYSKYGEPVDTKEEIINDNDLPF